MQVTVPFEALVGAIIPLEGLDAGAGQGATTQGRRREIRTDDREIQTFQTPISVDEAEDWGGGVAVID